MTIHDETKAHALAVAGKILVAMKAFYGCPHYRLTQSVVKLFTGEDVPLRAAARALEEARLRAAFFRRTAYPTIWVRGRPPDGSISQKLIGDVP